MGVVLAFQACVVVKPDSCLLADTALNSNCVTRSFVIFEILLSILSLYLCLFSLFSCIKSLLFQNSLAYKERASLTLPTREKSFWNVHPQKHSLLILYSAVDVKELYLIGLPIPRRDPLDALHAEDEYAARLCAPVLGCWGEMEHKAQLRV